MECIFCQISAQKAPARIVHEDELCLAFLDKKQASLGHTLIIPKQHYTDIYDIPAEVLAHLMVVAQTIAKKLTQHGIAQGINILHASKPVAQQSVFHFHLHVVPRRENDGLDLWYKEQDTKVSDLNKLVKKLNTLIR